MNKKNIPLQQLSHCLINGSPRDSRTAELRQQLEHNELDWQAIMPLADQNFATTILFWQLQQKELLPLLPEELQQLLGQLFELNSERNRIILDEVNTLAKLLNPADIEPIFLKGSAALLMGIYPAAGMRIMNDVDLLVPEQDLTTCVELMESVGYYPMEEVNLSENFYHLNPLVHAKHNIRFEIHKQLDLAYNPQVDTRDIIAESMPVKVEDGVVRIPNKTHFTLHNILHHQVFNKGLFTEDVPIYQLYDLYAIREKYDSEIDWLLITAFFKEHAFPDALSYPLGLLRKNFSQPAPSGVSLLSAKMLLIRGKRMYSRITNTE
jgi:hypothetical protein